jgi:tetratricopeptide (TPR) repeat protein
MYGFSQIPELQKADSLFESFQYEASLPFYEKAYNAHPDNYEVIWKYCRALVDAGEMQSDKDLRKEYYLKASQIIDKAIELEPNKPEGYLYAAIAYGRRALNAGAKERVKLSKKIRKSAEKAIELDPQNDIAYHVLARWHRKISNLSWIEKKFANIFLGGIPSDASMDKAVEYFQKAIELNPSYINHYLELGITFKMLKKWDEAKAALKKALELTAVSPRDKKYQKEAKKLFEKIKDK